VRRSTVVDSALILTVVAGSVVLVGIVVLIVLILSR
jgi:hypothetical protein